jgi:hypothetical protein
MQNQMKALSLTNDLAPRIFISNATSILNSEERIILPALKSGAQNIQNARKHSLTDRRKIKNRSELRCAKKIL